MVKRKRRNTSVRTHERTDVRAERRTNGRTDRIVFSNDEATVLGSKDVGFLLQWFQVR